MGKLIDADAVMKIVDEELALRCGYDADIACFSIKKKIAELPTAYDVKKVVEKLKEAGFSDESAPNRVVEIVRKGGVE